MQGMRAERRTEGKLICCAVLITNVENFIQSVKKPPFLCGGYEKKSVKRLNKRSSMIKEGGKNNVVYSTKFKPFITKFR